MSQPETENKLGPRHQQLGSQSLEEASDAFVLRHVGQDSESGLGVIEVAVLDTGLDHVERSRHDEGRAGAADGSDEVLSPGCRVVLLQAVDVFLGKSRATEKLAFVRQLIQNGSAENVPRRIRVRYGQRSIPHRGTIPSPRPR